MIENIKERVKQAYQNDKLLYPLVDEMCEEINGTETDVENMEVTDLGSGNAAAGKVATADGSGNVEWQSVPNELPAYNVSTDEGKVLKVGSEGVEWGSGSDKLYRHTFMYMYNSVNACFDIIDKKSDNYTEPELKAKLATTIPATGQFTKADTIYNVMRAYAQNNYLYVQGIIATSSGGSNSTELTFSKITQYVQEIN